MASDISSESLRVRIVATCAAVILVCLSGTAVHGIEAGKKKPVKASKPVFSVSAQESTAISSVSGPSSGLPVGTAAKSADTARHDGDIARHAARVVKDPAAVVQPALQPVVSGVQKKSADTLKKLLPAIVVNKQTTTAVPLKKHAFHMRSLMFRFIAFLASIAIIVVAIRFVKKQKATPRFLTTTRLSVMDKEVQHACRYIEKNFADPDLSVENICKDLTTGKAFLEALMERDLGVTVNDFIAHVRINRAKQVVAKDPSADSDAIASETGFANSAAFLAAFQKLTGVSFETYTNSRPKKDLT
jgi:AraC-like DNA-binding protein